MSVLHFIVNRPVFAIYIHMLTYVDFLHTTLSECSTRMRANAQRDGRPPNIGGALCSTPQSLADAHY